MATSSKNDPRRAASARGRGSEYFPTVTGRKGYMFSQELPSAEVFLFLVAIPARRPVQ